MEELYITKIKLLINEINKIDGNIKKSEECLNNPSNYSTKLLQNIYLELKDKYKNYIELYYIFKKIHKQTQEHNPIVERNKIINFIERLKNDELFISNECLKIEILMSKDLRIYNYILNNTHDFYYINNIIQNEIENISSSINYLPGVNELNKIVSENLDNDVYLNLRIIKAINRCNNKEESLKLAINEYYKIYDKFNEIHSIIEVKSKYSSKGLINSYVTKKIQKEFNKTKEARIKFIKEQSFLFSDIFEYKISILERKIKTIEKELNYLTLTKKERRCNNECRRNNN